MNPDHADESDQCDDMPRAVEHALRKHNAMDDELCRAVAGEVWQDMQADYDRVYGLWQDTVKELAEARRDAERYRWLRDNAKEELLYPARANGDMPDLRTAWALPVLICSGPVGGFLTFDEAIDIKLEAARGET
jgi:hypothetical protein